MDYFMKLNLPKNPLIDADQITATLVNGGYNLVEPRAVLTEEILDAFSDAKLVPKFVTLFGRGDKVSTLADRFIHTDVGLQSDLTWKKMLFGINWEIGDTENLFSWWNTDNVEAFWPDKDKTAAADLPFKYKLLNGIHYEKRYNVGIPANAVKLDEVMISQPTGPVLVRTDVAHATYYTSSITRVGVSVRFDESKFSEWSDVVSHLTPIKAA
jgi:hypothetical protein